MTAESLHSAGERRQFARALLPMTVTLEGREYKGYDLSLGGMSLVDVNRTVGDDAWARVSINRRDVRIDFVVEVMPIGHDDGNQLQRFRFLSLTKMQASIISLLMHGEEQRANQRPQC